MVVERSRRECAPLSPLGKLLTELTDWEVRRVRAPAPGERGDELEVEVDVVNMSKALCFLGNELAPAEGLSCCGCCLSLSLEGVGVTGNISSSLSSAAVALRVGRR